MTQATGEAALVLSGGGAYGAFEVGVMKVLFAGRSSATQFRPLDANIFTGTSVGAFNAAVMAGGLNSLEATLRLEEIWLQRIAARRGKCGNGLFRVRGNPANYVDPACLSSPATLAGKIGADCVATGSYWLSRTANFLASSTPIAARFSELINIGSFVDCAPYYDLLRDVLREEDILHSSRRLRVIATNWDTGQPAYFSNADFCSERGLHSVMASTAIPGFFPPVQIGGDTYVDGGVVENTPLSAAVGLGATELHVIFVDPDPYLIPLRASPNSIDTLLRVYYMMLATKIKEDIQTAKWINDGIRALQGVEQSLRVTSDFAVDLVRTAGKLLKENAPYRLITLHRYYPEATLGGNYGILDFELDPIVRMIAEGERSALTHDCEASQCLL
jgi:predicted acylesterase/phospholipase RssA